jgi:hypothetical protein
MTVNQDPSREVGDLAIGLYTSLGAFIVSVASLLLLFPSLASFAPLVPLALSSFGLAHNIRARAAAKEHVSRHAAELSFHFGVFSASIAALFVALALVGYLVLARG